MSSIKTPGVTRVESKRTYLNSINYHPRSDTGHTLEPVDRVERIHVDSGTVSPFTSDTLFGHVQDFRELFREMDARRHRGHGDDSAERDFILSRLNLLIQAFNGTMTGLRQFDAAYRTDHSYRVSLVLHLFRHPMASIGITAAHDNTLTLDPEVFDMTLKDSLGSYGFLFDNGGPFPRILDILKDVHIPKPAKKDDTTPLDLPETHVVDRKV